MKPVGSQVLPPGTIVPSARFRPNFSALPGLSGRRCSGLTTRQSKPHGNATAYGGIHRSNKSCSKVAQVERPKRTRQSPTPRNLTDHFCRGRGGDLRFTVSCRRFYRPSVPTSDRETAALPNAADLGRRPPGTGCRARVSAPGIMPRGPRPRFGRTDTPTGNPTPSMIYRGNIRIFQNSC